MSNSGSDHQCVGQLEFLTVTSSQSRCHNGNFSIKFGYREWETINELANYCNRRLAITRWGYERLSKG